MDGIVVVGLVGLAALVWQLIDFMREVRALPGSRSAVLTQLCAWAAGVAAVFLYGASQFGSTVVVGDIPISDMDGPTKLLVGVAVASVASSLVDFKQARDDSDSAKVPPLIPPGE